MDTDPLLNAIVLLISGMISFSIIWIIWPRRAAPGARALQFFMAGATIWAWTYSLHWLFPTWPARFFWLDATYIGVVIVPTAMLVFALQVNSLGHWINRRRLALLYVVPVLTLALLWTDPWHGLFFDGKRTPSSSDIYDGGIGFWFNIAYTYILLVVALYVIIRGLMRARGVYRQQHALILAGGCFPLLANALRFLGFAPFPGLDLTPIAFIFQGIFFAIGVFRFSIFDLVPVAREALLETMPEGLLVVDNRWRVVEANQSAAKLLGHPQKDLIGSNISVALAKWHELETWVKRADPEAIYQQLPFQDDLFMGVNITPLFNKEGRMTGRLVTWQDITQQLQTETSLEEANQQLRTQLREIRSLQATLKQQVIRDPLTNLLNRRFLEEALPKEVSRARRKEYPITILILDIDEFKRLNDTYGHAAGDVVLENLGRLFSRMTRNEDLAVRLGGEEFLILMNEVALDRGLKRADEIRHAIEVMESVYEGFSLPITVSIGVAEYPSSSQDIRDVMRKADQALYRAKYKGRNQVSR